MSAPPAVARNREDNPSFSSRGWWHPCSPRPMRHSTCRAAWTASGGARRTRRERSSPAPSPWSVDWCAPTDPRSVGEDDLVQDIFLAVFTRLDRYTARPGIPFEHWVARLAINSLPRRTSLRATAHPHRPGDSRVPGLDRIAPPGSPGHRRTRPSVRDRPWAHCSMPCRPPDRALLTWLHLEDRSVEEIAALTGWSRTAHQGPRLPRPATPPGRRPRAHRSSRGRG